MSKKGFLVLETGEVFQGNWLGGRPKAGEVVFNTSHSGYEEMASDPSYFSQILVATATMQGNYGVDDAVRESKKLSIHGFICLEMQNTSRDSSWLKTLDAAGVPVVDNIDTREIVLRLRSGGAVWGAMLAAENVDEAKAESVELIAAAKDIPSDWCQLVCSKEFHEVKGDKADGPKVAVVDFGCKNNIIRELKKRCSSLGVFPSTFSAEEIMNWKADGIMLSNGPGDPGNVEKAPEELRKIIGQLPIYGICMGHQILSLALGAKTFKLKFGHRGSNHPVKNLKSGEIYMTSQNHGYAVDVDSLPDAVDVSHVNLNDNTVSGISSSVNKCMSVQFHPESHPGPRDSVEFFDEFVNTCIAASGASQ